MVCVKGGSLIDKKRRQFSVWDISSPVWGPFGNILRTLKVRQKALFRDRELVRCACEGFSLKLPMFTLGLAGTVQVLFWTEHISNMKKTLIHDMQTFCTSDMLSGISQQPSYVYSQNCAWTLSEYFYKWCTDDMDIFNYWPKLQIITYKWPRLHFETWDITASSDPYLGRPFPVVLPPHRYETYVRSQISSKAMNAHTITTLSVWDSICVHNVTRTFQPLVCFPLSDFSTSADSRPKCKEALRQQGSLSWLRFVVDLGSQMPFECKSSEGDAKLTFGLLSR